MSATGRGTERNPADFYPTPAWCVRRILERLPLPGGRWLEPAAGEGAIVRAVNAVRGDVQWWAVELREECRPGLWETGANVAIDEFLLWSMGRAFGSPPFAVAILNPPFTLALPFVRRCLDVAEWVVCLERLNWLEGGDRNAFLRDHAPDVYVLPNRPSFTGKGTDATAYAWLVWPPGEHDRRAGRLEVLPTTSPAERAQLPPSVQPSLFGVD